jgi:hypothetical protein
MKKRVMSRRPPEPSDHESDGWLESITRFWVTIVIIGIILYVAVYAISRSDGFRDIVQQRLSEWSATPLSIRAARVDGKMNLILEGVNDAAARTNQLPGIDINYAKLKWRLFPLITGKGWPFNHLHLRDATFRFTPSTNGVWAPLPELEARLAPWMEVPGTSTNQPVESITELMRLAGINVTLENVTVIWSTGLPDEPPLARMDGVYVKSTSLQPFDDPVSWFEMKIGRAESGEVEWLTQVELAWIRMTNADVVLRQSGLILDEEQRHWQRTLLMEAQ